LLYKRPQRASKDKDFNGRVWDLSISPFLPKRKIEKPRYYPH
jgi:hypothetical protein